MAIQAVSMSSTADEARRCAALQEQQRLQQQQIAAKAKAASAQPTSGHPTQRRVPEYDGESRALARQQATAAPTRPAARTAPAATAKPVATPPPSGHPSQRKAPVYDGESRGLAREQAALQQGRPLTTSHGAQEAREGVSKEAALAPFQLVSTRPPASIAAPGSAASSINPSARGEQPLHAENAADSGRACGIGESGINVGGTAGATAEIGAPGLGSLGGTVSAGAGPFFDDGRTSVGGFLSYGGVANGATSSEYPPASEIKEHGLAGVVGVDAGVGGGLYVTNACSAKELGGPFDTFTVTTPFGSVQLGVSGGSVIDALTGKEGVTFIGSATAGKGEGWAVSAYPTDTRWTS